MSPRPVRVLGAPTDYGTSRRGVDMGPPAIRYADLAAALSAIGHTPRDHGDLRVRRVESDDPDVGRLQVEEIRLKESDLGPDGPTYRTVESVSL